LVVQTTDGFSYSLIENTKLQDYTLKFSKFTESVYNKVLLIKFKQFDMVTD